MQTNKCIFCQQHTDILNQVFINSVYSRQIAITISSTCSKRCGNKMATKMVLNSQNIRVINTELEHKQIADDLKRDCYDFNVLGFDCEWVNNFRPVALMQLATARGHIYLYRLCKMGHIPSDLKDLLENKEILKVGVDVLANDASKLADEYNVLCKGLFDVRFLAHKCGAFRNKFEKSGLSHLADKYLGMKLEKFDYRIHYKWENAELTDSLQMYAAADAFASIALFTAFGERLKPGRLTLPMKPINCHELLGRDCIDIRYSYESASLGKSNNRSNDNNLQTGKTSQRANHRFQHAIAILDYLKQYIMGLCLFIAFWYFLTFGK